MPEQQVTAPVPTAGGPDAEPATVTLPEPDRVSRGRRLLRLAREHKAATAGLAFLVVLVLASLFAPLPYGAGDTDSSSSLAAPSGDHWFGTDAAGGDIFSRVIVAARTDLSLALLGTVLSLVVGVLLGLAAST
ncbi:hypothetical protein [Nocardioides sp. TF02-7]|uniref:hypothetical protein n=1 Tax=Nocardioides sp. TF02-7 TaxID=2917724 RepID=UPI001F06D5D0|nr:hypothetical protein [Nocardioides sp. TF02-7]UMG93708.1 hypothetical protein MF408_05900 [Nocardioides sp. TF02-7]